MPPRIGRHSVGAACARPSDRVEDASAYVRRSRYPASCGPVIRRSGGYALRSARPARLKEASCSRPSQAASLGSAIRAILSG